MSAWYLLWMFVTVLGILATLQLTPFLLAWCTESAEDARCRQYAWWSERRRRREIELYGQPLRSCLYCGSVCEFGPDCANRDLHRSPKAAQARLRRELGRALDDLDEIGLALGKAELIALGDDPVSRLPCPCARCGKEATLLGAFQNSSGHIFCGFACYQAGGAT